jgi:hypothetical protein
MFILKFYAINKYINPVELQDWQLTYFRLYTKANSEVTYFFQITFNIINNM